MNWHRISALVLRYTFLYTRSLPRVFEIVFWPVMELMLWGMLTQYLQTGPYKLPAFINFLLGGMIFWDILYRSQQGTTISFLEDIWARNLINIFVAPVRVSEFIIATYCVGFVKILITVAVLGSLAAGLYHFNILSMGWPLIPLFINLLVMGWSVAMLTTGMIMRWGQASEALAWGIPFLIQPFCAAFYPVSSMPAWLQPIALSIPATHVFEGMRDVLAGQGLSWTRVLCATGLNVLYLTAAGLFFRYMYNSAREKGLLAKLGTQ
ncbi:MAG: ABC transporter permease [Verrucomicrobiota bacterium]